MLDLVFSTNSSFLSQHSNSISYHASFILSNKKQFGMDYWPKMRWGFLNPLSLVLVFDLLHLVGAALVTSRIQFRTIQRLLNTILKRNVPDDVVEGFD